MSRFFSQCKKELASYLVSSLVWAAVGVSLAFILQFITNTAVSMEKKNFPVIVVLVVGYLVLDMLFEFLMGHTKYRSRTKLSMLLRGAIVHRIEVLDLDEKERYGDAHYLSLVNNDVTEVETGYVDGILSVIFQLFSLLFALAATTYIEPMLTVIAILLCVLPIIVPKLLQKKLVQVNRTALTEKSRYLNVVNELLQGFLTLRVFRRFPQYNQYHDKQNKTLVSALWRNNQWKRLSMSLSYGVGNLVVQGAWVAGLAFALSGKITVPEMVAVTSLMTLVAGPFQIISERYADIVGGRAIADDLLKFIDSAAKKTSYQFDTNELYSIALTDVSVMRDDRPILKNVNISINRGEKIALVGASGSGKSTLLRVLAGVIMPEIGTVSINKSIVRVPNGNFVHPGIVLTTQSTSIFSTSIRNNVSLFAEYEDCNMIEALNENGLNLWFENHDNDLYRELSKSQANLSGGELRRLDFARVILEDAQAVLLDEPTSGLDTFNTGIIMDKLMAMQDKIVVVATHDLREDFLGQFDRIYIVENGQIASSGTYKDILNTLNR